MSKFIRIELSLIRLQGLRNIKGNLSYSMKFNEVLCWKTIAFHPFSKKFLNLFSYFSYQIFIPDTLETILLIYSSNVLLEECSTKKETSETRSDFKTEEIPIQLTFSVILFPIFMYYEKFIAYNIHLIEILN